MDNSTASHKLRKLILFSLVQQTAQDICFRCQTKIETVEEISIEHKMPWLDSSNPVSIFFDLTNLAGVIVNEEIIVQKRDGQNTFTMGSSLPAEPIFKNLETSKRCLFSISKCRQIYCPVVVGVLLPPKL